MFIVVKSVHFCLHDKTWDYLDKKVERRTTRASVIDLLLTFTKEKHLRRRPPSFPLGSQAHSWRRISSWSGLGPSHRTWSSRRYRGKGKGAGDEFMRNTGGPLRPYGPPGTRGCLPAARAKVD
jgi:hypothetical protein